jgi:multiple sugar transport system substrate-binding protein
MEEITFSVFEHGAGSVENLPMLLREFEQQYGIRVHLEVISSWTVGWSRLVEVALYHNGPDVSEIGDTWVGDLVRMEALRPFKREEVDEITQGARYFDTVWRCSTRDEHGTPTVYSIPLVSDARVVFYRRDLLEKAGVNEATAFEDFAHFEKTLSSMKEKGIPMPLALPTRRSHMTIHYIASWIWGAGGNFLSPDGTSLAFDQPQALEGCKTYFRLVHFLSPEARDLEEAAAEEVFCKGEAAVLPSGFWILSNELAAEVRKNLAAVPMPGVPFVGGHHVVIWNHSRHEVPAIKLIQFLHTEEAGKLLYPLSGLPISEDGWSSPPFDSELYQVFKASIQKGRGFPTARLWGLVEKRLTDVFTDIWTEVQREPEARLDTIVETHLVNLARRLQLSLGS